MSDNDYKLRTGDLVRHGPSGDMTEAKDIDCVSCEEAPEERCPQTQRHCGHHCNHSWSHDVCCWCGREWGLDNEGANQ